jgi:hypothetical protein
MPGPGPGACRTDCRALRLIGTSNFFELAVAVAIGLFGLNSGAALATVVGVLVEVPVMLSLVAFANRTRVRLQRYDECRQTRIWNRSQGALYGQAECLLRLCGAANVPLTSMSDDAHRRTVRDAYAQVAQVSGKGQSGGNASTAAASATMAPSTRSSPPVWVTARPTWIWRPLAPTWVWAAAIPRPLPH